MELGHLLLYSGSPLEFALVLTLALALDALYPYHRGVLLLVHPVHTSYRMALFLHRPHASRMWGVALGLFVIASHLLAYAVLLIASGLLWEPLHVLAGAWIVKVSIGNRLLVDTVRRVQAQLRQGDLKGARESVSGLVRRETSRLGEGHVASAAIESLSESLVDGLVSPLLYYTLAGPLGALLQRVVNTLDGAVGFREPEFLREGWFSARLDTLLNYLPARLTAGLVILLCGHGTPRSLASCIGRWAPRTPSVNAGYPMSAFACCLNVVLEKRGAYRLGRGSLPSAPHVALAVGLYWRVTVFFLLLATTMGCLLRALA